MPVTPSDEITLPPSSLLSHKRGMRLAQFAWIVTAGLSLAVLVGSAWGYAVWFRGQNPLVSGSQFSAFNILAGLNSLITVLICLFLGVVLFRQKRHEPMALFVSFFIIAYGVTFTGPLENLNVLIPGMRDAAVTYIEPVLLTVPIACLMFLLPDGRPVPAWTRWLIPISLVTLAFLPFITTEAIMKFNTLPAVFWAGSVLVLYGIGIGAQVYRYRRISTPVQREQTRWVVYGLALWVIMIVLQSVPYTYLQYLPPGTTRPAWAAVFSAFWWLTLAIVPVTLSISTLRYRLYDIDLIINRTLVYGGLTAILAGLYAASISLCQRLFIALTGQKSDAAVVLTTLILASTFTPIKTRLQALVDRRFRDVHEPLHRLPEFIRQIEAGVWLVDPKKLLRRLLEEAVAALGASGGMIEWWGEDKRTIRITLGSWKGDCCLSAPLKDSDKMLGQINLGAPKDNPSYDSKDLKRLTAAAQSVAHLLASVQPSESQ